MAYAFWLYTITANKIGTQRLFLSRRLKKKTEENFDKNRESTGSSSSENSLLCHDELNEQVFPHYLAHPNCDSEPRKLSREGQFFPTFSLHVSMFPMANFADLVYNKLTISFFIIS